MQLLRMLSACVFLGHSDLHRKNLGLRHLEGLEGEVARLAPMYDVSSGDSRSESYTRHLRVGFAGETLPDRIGERQWRKLARACGVDEGKMLEEVRKVAAELPDVLEEAYRQSKDEDEVTPIAQEASRKGVETVIAKAESRCRKYTQEKIQGRGTVEDPKGPELPRRGGKPQKTELAKGLEPSRNTGWKA